MVINESAQAGYAYTRIEKKVRHESHASEKYAVLSHPPFCSSSSASQYSVFVWWKNRTKTKTSTVILCLALPSSSMNNDQSCSVSKEVEGSYLPRKEGPPRLETSKCRLRPSGNQQGDESDRWKMQTHRWKDHPRVETHGKIS